MNCNEERTYISIRGRRLFVMNFLMGMAPIGRALFGPAYSRWARAIFDNYVIPGSYRPIPKGAEVRDGTIYVQTTSEDPEP